MPVAFARQHGRDSRASGDPVGVACRCVVRRGVATVECRRPTACRDGRVGPGRGLLFSLHLWRCSYAWTDVAENRHPWPAATHRPWHADTGTPMSDPQPEI